MSRPLRVEEPGLWHHVMNRGQGRRAVFRAPGDHETFLELVGDAAARWGLRPHAYCLMTNHYHLLVEDVLGHLSRALRHIDGVYTQRWNRRHRTDGALFRGRFRSRVVQTERYVVGATRYVHRNPVDAHMVATAAEHAWSSHRHYLSRLGRPEWLVVEHVLGSFGGDSPAGRRSFDEFVHEGAPPEVRAQLDPARWSPILGDDEIASAVRQRLRARDADRDVAHARRLRAATVTEIVAAACSVFAVSREELLAGRRGTTNVPRQLALRACRDFSVATGAEIAGVFGIAAPTVSVHAHRVRSLIDADRHTARLWRALVDRIASTP